MGGTPRLYVYIPTQIFLVKFDPGEKLVSNPEKALEYTHGFSY